MTKAKRLIISSILLLVMVVVFSVTAEASDYPDNLFSFGAGYIFTPVDQGAFIEGVIRPIPRLNLFAGIIPAFDGGLAEIALLGFNYDFKLKGEEMIYPGIGLILLDEQISPIVAITIREQKDEITINFRGGYNIFTVSAGINF